MYNASRAEFPAPPFRDSFDFRSHHMPPPSLDRIFFMVSGFRLVVHRVLSLMFGCVYPILVLSNCPWVVI